MWWKNKNENQFFFTSRTDHFCKNKNKHQKRTHLAITNWVKFSAGKIPLMSKIVQSLSLDWTKPLWGHQNLLHKFWCPSEEKSFFFGSPGSNGNKIEAARGFSVFVGQTEASVGIFPTLDFRNFGSLPCRTNWSTPSQVISELFPNFISSLKS